MGRSDREQANRCNTLLSALPTDVDSRRNYTHRIRPMNDLCHYTGPGRCLDFQVWSGHCLGCSSPESYSYCKGCDPDSSFDMGQRKPHLCGSSRRPRRSAPVSESRGDHERGPGQSGFRSFVFTTALASPKKSPLDSDLQIRLQVGRLCALNSSPDCRSA